VSFRASLRSGVFRGASILYPKVPFSFLKRKEKKYKKIDKNSHVAI
jgi:hypothetical protein